MPDEVYDPDFRPWNTEGPYDPHYWPGVPSALRGRVLIHPDGTRRSARTGRIFPTWLHAPHDDGQESHEAEMLFYYDRLEVIETDEEHKIITEFYDLRRAVEDQMRRGGVVNPIVWQGLEKMRAVAEPIIENLPETIREKEEAMARTVAFVKKQEEEKFAEEVRARFEEELHARRRDEETVFELLQRTSARNALRVTDPHQRERMVQDLMAGIRAQRAARANAEPAPESPVGAFSEDDLTPEETRHLKEAQAVVGCRLDRISDLLDETPKKSRF